VLIELGLDTLERRSAGSEATVAQLWDAFYKEHVIDEEGNLLPTDKALRRTLGCTEEESVTADNLKAILRVRGAHPGLFKRIVQGRLDPGFCCGGGAEHAGCANGIAIHLLQKQGLPPLRTDIKYIDQSFKQTHIFRFDGTIEPYSDSESESESDVDESDSDR
jgi:hypothetical protein